MWQIFLSGIVGALVSLTGVAAGAVLAGRTQSRHWLKDKQVEACTRIVVESARTQMALYENWRRGERVDWYPWNEALAMTALVGPIGLVEAAAAIDEAFWARDVPL